MDAKQIKEALENSQSKGAASFDFSDKVMQKLEEESAKKWVYQPLIPKPMLWTLISCYLLLCLIPMVFGLQESVLSILDTVQLVGLDTPQIQESAQPIAAIGFVFVLFTFAEMLMQWRSRRLV